MARNAEISAGILLYHTTLEWDYDPYGLVEPGADLLATAQRVFTE